MVDEWKSNALGLISVAVTLIALINKEQRLLAAIISIGAVVFYIINSFSSDIKAHEDKIKKLEEKLSINDQLVGLKSDIEYLKKEVSKK